MHRQEILKTMTLAQKQELKKKISEDLDFLEREVIELEEKMKPIIPDCCIGSDERFEMMSEQEVFERILYEAKIRITKLKYTINKVDGDEYGICMECEEDIPYQRLLILPESSYCTKCASDLQKRVIK